MRDISDDILGVIRFVVFLLLSALFIIISILASYLSFGAVDITGTIMFSILFSVLGVLISGLLFLVELRQFRSFANGFIELSVLISNLRK